MRHTTDGPVWARYVAAGMQVSEKRRRVPDFLAFAAMFVFFFILWVAT